MQKIQVMVDDRLAEDLKSSAKLAGLSISSYVRVLLSNVYKNDSSSLKNLLLNADGAEETTGEEFMQELRQMIKNA
jgi:antitoxin component of RelBE/YafQ-DinJ toxin-antitoxin module